MPRHTIVPKEDPHIHNCLRTSTVPIQPHRAEMEGKRCGWSMAGIQQDEASLAGPLHCRIFISSSMMIIVISLLLFFFFFFSRFVFTNRTCGQLVSFIIASLVDDNRNKHLTYY